MLARRAYKDAVAAAQETVRLASDEPRGYQVLAGAYLGLRQWQQAVDTTDAGLAIAPEHETLLTIRGLALRQLGRGSESQDAFEGALRRRPGELVRARQPWARAPPRGPDDRSAGGLPRGFAPRPDERDGPVGPRRGAQGEEPALRVAAPLDAVAGPAQRTGVLRPVHRVLPDPADRAGTGPARSVAHADLYRPARRVPLVHLADVRGRAVVQPDPATRSARPARPVR